jgi:hypothetical protein
MNTEKVEGKFDQVAGKIKQSVGEAIGIKSSPTQVPQIRSRALRKRLGEMLKTQQMSSAMTSAPRLTYKAKT